MAAITFNPAHKYVVWFDFSGANGKIIMADEIEVTTAGVLIFSSRGNDGVMYVTEVIPAKAYAHFNWYGDADVVPDEALPTG
jgi:hypothetical protein